MDLCDGQLNVGLIMSTFFICQLEGVSSSPPSFPSPPPPHFLPANMSASLSFTPSSLTKHIQHFTTKVQGAGGFPAGAALILVAKRRRSQSRELSDTRSSESCYGLVPWFRRWCHQMIPATRLLVL